MNNEVNEGRGLNFQNTKEGREEADALVAKMVSRQSVCSGSVVRLKSGGPSMTVVDRGSSWAYVMWHKDDGNDVLRDWVPISSLEVVPK